MEEIWKPIPGYEGRYSVSNQGRIMAHMMRNGKVDRVLNTKPCKSGYTPVALSKPIEGVKMFHVHTLVNLAFNGPPPEYLPITLHKDDIRHHNTPDNLYWGNYTQNVEDAILNGRRHRSVKNL